MQIVLFGETNPMSRDPTGLLEVLTSPAPDAARFDVSVDYMTYAVPL